VTAKEKERFGGRRVELGVTSMCKGTVARERNREVDLKNEVKKLSARRGKRKIKNHYSVAIAAKGAKGEN